MTDLANLRIKVDSTEVKKAEADLENMGSAAVQAEAAVGGLGNATNRANAGTRQMTDAMRQAHTAQSVAAASMGAVAGSTKIAHYHMLNLGFQLQDIFVSIMSGQKPLQILAQQGTQIAGIMMQAGVGVMALARAVVGLAAAGVAAALTNPILLGIAAAATLAYAALKSFQATVKSTGELDAYANSLGLTTEEMKQLSSTGVTLGDVFRGIGKTISDALNLQKVFAAIGEFWSKAMKVVGDVTLKTTAAIYAYYAGSFNAIKTLWQNFPSIMSSIAVSAVNGVVGAVETMINRVVSGINVLVGAANTVMSATGSGLRISTIEAVKLGRMANENANVIKNTSASIASGYTSAYQQAKRLGGAISENIIAASKDRMANEAAAIVSERNAKAKGDVASAARQASQEVSNLADELERLIESTLNPAERAARDAAAAVLVLRRAFELGMISAEQMHDVIRRLDNELERMVETIPDNVRGLKAIDDSLKGTVNSSIGFASDLEAMADKMADAFEVTRDAVDDVFYAIADRNWAGAVSAAIKAVKSIKTSYGDMVASGMSPGQAGLGTAGNVAGTVGSMVGGKLGKGLSGFAAGAQMVSALGTLMPSLAVSGPVGWAIAAGLGLYAAFGGSKPSNNAAISTINGDNFSIGGSKRNDQTTQLAETASKGIIAGQQALAKLGATLGTTVTAIDIGTRDLTHIFLNGGREVRSAVADAGDAVKVALQAVLEGATFLDEGQQKFVDSMRAAGKGFDELLVALEKYKEAQMLGTQIEDEILRLSDPQKYELMKLTRSQQETRDSLKALADEGYITATQFALWSSRLDVLETLQVKELEVVEATETLASVMNEASGKLKDVLSQLDQNVSSAEGALRSVYERELQALEAAASSRSNASEALRQAYDREMQSFEAALSGRSNAVESLKQAYSNQAQALNSTANTFRQLQSGLLAFSASLAQASGGEAYAINLRRRFDSLVSLGRLGNAEAMAALPEVGAKLKDQIMETATDRMSMLRQLASMRVQTDAVAGVAGRQVSNAEAQLTALNAQVSALIDLGQKTLTVEEAIKNLQTAEEAYELAQQQKQALTDQVSGLIDLNESFVSVADAIKALQTAEEAYELAQQQRQVLTDQVSGLIDLNDSFVSVADAIKNLQTAEAAYELAQQQKQALTDQVSAVIDLNTSVLSVADAIAQVEAARAEREAVIQQIQEAGFASLIEVTKQTSSEIVTAILRMINESRASDGLSSVSSVTTSTVSSSQTYDPSAAANDPVTVLSGEVTALRDDMNGVMYTVAKSTAKTYDIFSRWDSDGMPEIRVLA
jgi:hypothetical protein